MTEPQGGADPKVFTTTAVQDGDHWVINGEKWFSSFASMASFIIVMAMTDPGRAAVRAVFDVRRAGRDPGYQRAARRRPWPPAAGWGSRGLCAVRKRPRPCRSHARTTRRCIRGRADAVGRRADPPRDAHRRTGPAHLRHDLRTGRIQVHPGRDAVRQAAGPGDGRGLVDGDRGIPPAHLADGMEDRPAQRLQGRSRGHLGGQGDDAEGASRRVGTRTAAARLAGHDARDAVRLLPGGVLRPRTGRRADRGAQGHAGPLAAQGSEAGARHVPVGAPAPAAGGGGGEVRRQACGDSPHLTTRRTSSARTM